MKFIKDYYLTDLHQLIKINKMAALKRPALQDLLKELEFNTSRSSGPGGQNVNKLNTKVMLKFDVINSLVLNEEQKELIQTKLKTKLTKEGVLQIITQDLRSQLKNKEKAIKKFDSLINQVFTFKKKRKATKPTKASKQSRSKEKKLHSEKKSWRKKPL
jgi:ribosome-associated protein